MINISIYETVLTQKDNSFLYLFESVGNKTIIKAVQFAPFETLNGTIIYNFGFGDFDLNTNNVIDHNNSNNGDMRMVFNTVLSTIPDFFQEKPYVPIYIQGSDYSEEFELFCRKNCSKNCIEFCKNKNRRMKSYIYFINKNLERINQQYLIFGMNEDEIEFHKYVPENKYIALLIYKK